MSRELIPDQDNPYLELGRFIEKNFYKREGKFFEIKDMKIDLIRGEKENLLISEIKKSSRYEKSILMQVSFYLKKLKENGVFARGEILIPKERKRIRVELTPNIEKELDEAFENIEKTILKETPPKIEKIPFCKNCAYREFCWS